jgi:hypothetical protein
MAAVAKACKAASGSEEAQGSGGGTLYDYAGRAAALEGVRTQQSRS